MSGNSSNAIPKLNPKPRFSLTENYQECLGVLDEFVSDIEAVESDPNRETVEITWPDLWTTYLKARKLVRDE